MILGVPRENHPGERRVAVVPAVVPSLVKAGLDVLVEMGAGLRAGFPDAAYQEQGARIAPDRAQLMGVADVVVLVHGPRDPLADGAALSLLRPGQVLAGLLDPLGVPQVALELAKKGVTAFALELLPRISRAQPMDALSSMATVAGYKAVLLAAADLPKLYPMMMTAAGTIAPARVLVLGAGVAGLQAIATSRRLGAVVQAYDIRPAVKEQVESLGAKFVQLEMDTAGAEGQGGYARAMGEDFTRRQQELLARVVADSDVVIATAAVPGAKAPVLVSESMVRGMRLGSVIVDLAAEWGGNCAMTRAGETVDVGGVTVLGPVNLAASVPFHASQMYARNISSFLLHLVKDGQVQVDLADPIASATLVTRGGQVVNARVRELLGVITSSAKEAS